MRKRRGQAYYFNRHSCFLLQYHLVLVTKFRAPALTGAIKESVYQTIRNTCDMRGYNILELNGEADHLHLLFEASADMAPQEFANVIKTRTARFARRDCPDEVKRFYWDEKRKFFWTDSYFITTVSTQSLDVVQQYIQNQGKK